MKKILPNIVKIGTPLPKIKGKYMGYFFSEHGILGCHGNKMIASVKKVSGWTSSQATAAVIIIVRRK